MSKEQTPSIISWLHRYIFRGFGWVFLGGMLFWLYLFFRAAPHK
jgi:hypothetical protein